MSRRMIFAAALLLPVLVASGCGSSAPAPTVRLDGAYLMVENLTGKDVHVQFLSDPPLQAWIPTSLPGNRIEHKRHLRVRIAPSSRGKSIVLAWWHPGKEIGNSGIPGPDKVRRIEVMLDPPPQPLPVDEQVVLSCIEASQALRTADSSEEARDGRRFHRQRLDEHQCMDDAEKACFRGNECPSRLQFWRDALEQANQDIARPSAR